MYPNKGIYLLQHGGVAQLGEHLPCKQGVDSSILFISTKALFKRDGAGLVNEDLRKRLNGLIAQVVRARA